MAVIYDRKNEIIQLNTKNTSYVIGIVDKEGFVGHAYYGKKLGEDALAYLMRIYESFGTPETNARDRLSFYDALVYCHKTTIRNNRIPIRDLYNF